METIIRSLQKSLFKGREIPDFKAGATITVHYKIKEGNKERIQQFQGVVIQRRGSGATETFTVRKISGNTGVERIFPVASPFIEKIEVNKVGAVRRARIFYFRERRGKSARIREKRSNAVVGGEKNEKRSGEPTHAEEKTVNATVAAAEEKKESQAAAATTGNKE